MFPCCSVLIKFVWSLNYMKVSFTNRFLLSLSLRFLSNFKTLRFASMDLAYLFRHHEAHLEVAFLYLFTEHMKTAIIDLLISFFFVKNFCWNMNIKDILLLCFFPIILHYSPSYRLLFFYFLIFFCFNIALMLKKYFLHAIICCRTFILLVFVGSLNNVPRSL